MMKLILSLTLIWALSSTARALECMTCTDAQCSSTIPLTCDQETMCVTVSINATSGTTEQQIFKGCASSKMCPSNDTQTLSASLGPTVEVASANCCNTNNCNAETIPCPCNDAFSIRLGMVHLLLGLLIFTLC